jgi:hypothetical protein
MLLAIKEKLSLSVKAHGEWRYTPAHPRLWGRWRWAGGFNPSRFPSLERAPYPLSRWVSWNRTFWILWKTQNLFSLPGNELRTFVRVTRSLYPSRYLISSVATKSTKTLRFLQPLYFSFQVAMFQDETLATPHSSSPVVWLTRWLMPTQKICVTHREVIRLYGVCCRRYGWHPRPFSKAMSSYVHKLWSLGYHDAHVDSWSLELFAILYYSHIISRFRKIAESEYQFRRVCPSLRMEKLGFH